jgi:hypothetical protein
MPFRYDGCTLGFQRAAILRSSEVIHLVGKCTAGWLSAFCILLQTVQHLPHGVLVVLCASMLGEFRHLYLELLHLRDCSGRVCQGVVIRFACWG